MTSKIKAFVATITLATIISGCGIGFGIDATKLRNSRPHHTDLWEILRKGVKGMTLYYDFDGDGKSDFAALYSSCKSAYKPRLFGLFDFETGMLFVYKNQNGKNVKEFVPMQSQSIDEAIDNAPECLYENAL